MLPLSVLITIPKCLTRSVASTQKLYVSQYTANASTSRLVITRTSVSIVTICIQCARAVALKCSGGSGAQTSATGSFFGNGRRDGLPRNRRSDVGVFGGPGIQFTLRQFIIRNNVLMALSRIVANLRRRKNP